MPVDIEQWLAEIGNFNGCLHYAIIKSEINLLNIMVRAIILTLNFHFLIIFFIFVSLSIVLNLTVNNTGLCFKFYQHCHKIPYLEDVRLTLPPRIFSVQVKSGACYITGPY